MTIKRTATYIAITLLSLTAIPATATIIYDGSTLPRGDSDYYYANSGAFGLYTFHTPETISSFSTLNALRVCLENRLFGIPV